MTWAIDDVQRNVERLRPAPRMTPFVSARLAAILQQMRDGEEPGRLMRKVAEIAMWLGNEHVEKARGPSDPIEMVRVRDLVKREDQAVAS